MDTKALIDLMDAQEAALMEAFEQVELPELPSIPMINQKQILDDLPVQTSAIYFISGHAICQKSEKGVIMFRMDEHWAKEKYGGKYIIPGHGPRDLFYIGRAVNLYNRWKPVWNIAYTEIIQQHHRIEEALTLLIEPRLSWLEMPKQYLGVSEIVLIRLHQPWWNNRL